MLARRSLPLPEQSLNRKTSSIDATQFAIELERAERTAVTLDCGIRAVGIRCCEARRKSFRVVERLVADLCSMRVVPARARICRHAVQHDEVKIRRLDAPLNELYRIARADPRRELPGVLWF